MADRPGWEWRPALPRHVWHLYERIRPRLEVAIRHEPLCGGREDRTITDRQGDEVCAHCIYKESHYVEECGEEQKLPG